MINSQILILLYTFTFFSTLLGTGYAQIQGYFTHPPPLGQNDLDADNMAYYVGQQVQVQWSTVLVNFWCAICHENLPRNSVAPVWDFVFRKSSLAHLTLLNRPDMRGLLHRKHEQYRHL